MNYFHCMDGDLQTVKKATEDIRAMTKQVRLCDKIYKIEMALFDNPYHPLYNPNVLIREDLAHITPILCSEMLKVWCNKNIDAYLHDAAYAIRDEGCVENMNFEELVRIFPPDVRLAVRNRLSRILKDLEGEE